MYFFKKIDSLSTRKSVLRRYSARISRSSLRIQSLFETSLFFNHNHTPKNNF